MLWSIAVMFISGLLLGVLGKLIDFGRGPLMTGIGVASCTFAYYLSQLPIIAAATYGHGLVFIALPVIIIFLGSLTYTRLIDGKTKP
jgi:hypothetical protein